MKKVNVLVYPCGSENALEIHQALRYSLHVNLYGASSIDDIGKLRYERYIGGVPMIHDENFDDAFKKIIDKYDIQVVFATHDTVMEHLSQKQEKLGFYLVNGDPKLARIARKKSLTYALFADHEWCPKTFETIEEVDEWPIIIKPDMGQGAQGVTLVHNKEEADKASKSMRHPVMVEYLPGEELTVDCFSDRNKKMIWIGPRTRDRVKAGITMKSHFLEVTDEIREIAHTINDALPLRGPWFFQVKKGRNGRWKLLEISTRIAGTMVAQRARGINLPLMAIHDYNNRDLTTLPLPHIKYIERFLSTKSEIEHVFHHVYVDLDDTLILNGHTVPLVIAFLFQMRKEGKKIVLISRHEYDIRETLREHAISEKLFDEIIHIKDKSLKSLSIKKDSIFIDNHFPERKDVYDNLQIPVFDVDMLDFFLK